MRILVDADACPVKDEVYRVALRVGVPVLVVANSWMNVPSAPSIELIVVSSGQLDEADDRIVELASTGDVVVTSDIPLAARCLEKGAQVLRPDGRPFSLENIGDALASRELMAELREMGAIQGGPGPFSKKDRSRFLHALDEALRSLA